ncbi:hypothetical protein FA13DRAFT_1806195 [Coprinellus micaceus]|uniref:Uncharacterized protein n=1 Tax=Coprinellus micaceus TaxID=71717 RepID=A0A4Y7RPZ7_COPMI|nr:hypothetical protein FA13DRAFT_1806195 [Coprinellus micaceus]
MHLFALRDALIQTTQCNALGTLFIEVFGPQQGRIPLLHRKFFLEIVAEESVLQLVNGKALIRLKQFLTPPNAQDSVSLINGIPAFYHLYHIHPNPLGASPHI